MIQKGGGRGKGAGDDLKTLKENPYIFEKIELMRNETNSFIYVYVFFFIVYLKLLMCKSLNFL